MSKHDELVKALRCNALSKQCDSCKYGYHLCPDSECNDACQVEQVYADAAAAIEELQAQLPKRGKWILENYCWHCSACGENPTRGMGYVQGKNELFRVCPHCGAKMEEEC